MGNIFLEKIDKEAKIIISNPEKKNAISYEMWVELNRILDEIRENKEIRLLIISGEGQNFSAGADISQFKKLREDSNREDYDFAIYSAGSKLKNLLIPTIAEIRGYCFGGGFGLTLKCDFRFADEGSIFAIPAVKRGFGYNTQNIKDLVDVVGLSNAKDILLTGRNINFDEALKMGLVKNINNYLNKPLDCYDNILIENAPLAVEAIKAGFLEIMGESDSGISSEEKNRLCFQSLDYKEACNAFIEKRKPKFKGK